MEMTIEYIGVILRQYWDNGKDNGSLLGGTSTSSG